jgi:hypothetical protein
MSAKKKQLCGVRLPDPVSAPDQPERPINRLAEYVDQREFLTRAEIPAFLKVHGFPVSRSTLDKLSMPSRGDHAGPKPAGAWGNRHLYRPADVLEWARSRFRSIAV